MGQLSRRELVRGNCTGVKILGGSCPGGNFKGDNCPEMSGYRKRIRKM